MTEPMKTAQLLPCPFCGTEPEWINEALPDSHYYIRCPHCKFVMKEDRRDKVVGMWNRREQVAAERERIKKLVINIQNDWENENGVDEGVDALQQVIDSL